MKRFIAILMTLCLILGLSSVSVWAATIGNPLTNVETGWKRFDNLDKNIQYLGDGWKDYTDNSSSKYKGSERFSSVKTDQIKFKFSGTKLRIISTKNKDRAVSTSIKIDGQEYSFSTLNSTWIAQILVFEKTDLNSGIHEVTIYNNEKDNL